MNLNAVLEQVGRDRGLDRTVLVETLETALKTAAKRVFGEQRDIEAQFNDEIGEIELFLIITVAEDVENRHREISLEEAREYIDPNAEAGDELLFQIFYRDEDLDKAKEQDRRYGKLLDLESARRTFGRIAAQTAKQVIIQRIREAERENIYEEYKDRKNELITGIVRRFERGSIIVDLGRTDAILPGSEQTRRESYRPGDRIQGFVKDVVRGGSRDIPIVLSRTDPGLVIKLFEQEVPEIYEGIVKIVAVAREPGIRSKVAVYSTDSDVDAVGACVGMRGSRVQAVVQELRGEKIDIVPYDTNSARFVCNAISPAHVAKVLLDETRRSMELIVPDDQLSLAIGRGGQNVRLAAQLTGWNLEILSETRLQEMAAEAKQELLTFDGVSETMVDTLFSLGFNKLEDISLADPADIAQMPGFNEARAVVVIEAASTLLARPEQTEDGVASRDGSVDAFAELEGVDAETSGLLAAGGFLKPLHLTFAEDAAALAERTGLDADRAAAVFSAAQAWYTAQGFSEDEHEEHDEEKEEWIESYASEKGSGATDVMEKG
ncbi:MAG: transcription termination/antitermination protein NusA [Deltaproteobacteria bacterium]|nr:MAG: transcription termination/antitermination protein NusA [Deltaproteobacteria bacterium]